MQGLELPALAQLHPPAAAPIFAGAFQGSKCIRTVLGASRERQLHWVFLASGDGCEQLEEVSYKPEPVSILISSKRLNKLDLSGMSVSRLARNAWKTFFSQREAFAVRRTLICCCIPGVSKCFGLVVQLWQQAGGIGWQGSLLASLPLLFVSSSLVSICGRLLQVRQLRMQRIFWIRTEPIQRGYKSPVYA